MIEMPVCNKIPFATKSDALAYSASVSRDGWTKRHFKSGRVFQCHLCQQWHLTRCSGSRNKKLKRSHKGKRLQRSKRR